MARPARTSVGVLKPIHIIAKVEAAKADVPVIKWVEDAILEKKERIDKGEE